MQTAVIADQRIGHQHHLARVRGIGADLLVAGGASVGDEIAAAGDGCAKCDTFEHCAVFEGKQRRPKRANSRIDYRVGRKKKTTARI